MGRVVAFSRKDFEIECSRRIPAPYLLVNMLLYFVHFLA